MLIIDLEIDRAIPNVIGLSTPRSCRKDASAARRFQAAL